MSKDRITVKKALELIKEGKSLSSFEVVFEETIDAIKAFHLRKNGIDVPDQFITYEDEDLTYDEDIDNTDWQKLDGYVDETDSNINVDLVVEKEVKNWLTKNNIKVEELLSNLLHNYYQTDQIVHRK